MKYPERGILRVTGSYDAHPHSPSSGTRVTGIITAPGIPETQVEHKSDDHDRWAGVKEVPVLVDRADPSKFVILWDEAMPMSWQDQDIQQGPRTTLTTTATTMGPDGRPISPEMAAQLQAKLGKLFNKPGGRVLGDMLNQAIGQAFDQFGGQGPSQAGNQPYGQQPAQPYSQPTGQPYGQPASQSFGQVDPQAFGQPDPQAFGQPTQQGAEWQQPTWPASQAPAPSGGFLPGGVGPSAPNGERASAVVLSAQDVGTPGYGVQPGMVDLTLEVTRANGSTYTAPARMSFSTPEQRAAVATPGTRLGVRIDPNAPARVTIDPTSRY